MTLCWPWQILRQGQHRSNIAESCWNVIEGKNFRQLTNFDCAGWHVWQLFINIGGEVSTSLRLFFRSWEVHGHVFLTWSECYYLKCLFEAVYNEYITVSVSKGQPEWSKKLHYTDKLLSVWMFVCHKGHCHLDIIFVSSIYILCKLCHFNITKEDPIVLWVERMA